MEENELDDGILDCIIVTHEHYDHICGVNRWVERFGCPVWCGHAAVQGLRDPRINLSHYGSGLFRLLPQWVECDNKFGEIKNYSCNANVFLENGQIFDWQGNTFLVLETPGHSPGSICLLVNQVMLLSGDVLLKDSPSCVRIRGGNRCELLEKSFPLLRRLDQNILVLPGHGGSFYLRDYSFWGETT